MITQAAYWKHYMEETKTKQHTHKYQPKFGRVLIERKVTTKTSGGIILTNDSAKRYARCEGTIVAMGETAGWVEVYENGSLVPKKIFDVGDKVMFGKFAGAWLDQTSEEKDDGTLFICADADILATIKE